MSNINFNELVVVKRSGQRVAFNGNKIAIAIKSAFDSLESKYQSSDINKVYEDVLNFIKDTYSDRKTINVEDIQDIIEEKLKSNKYNLVYEAFNSYRLRRAASRDVFTEKQQHKFVKAIEKLGLPNDKNLNDTPLQTMIGFAKTISKEFAKAYLVENKYIRAHDEGLIYIHDLSYYPISTTTSSHLDFTNIYDENIENYLFKIYKIISSCKNEQTGEHSIDAIDKLLTPVIISNYKLIFRRKLNDYLKVAGIYEFLDINKIIEKVQSIDRLDYDINLFNEFILNNNIKNVFESCHSDSINQIKEILNRSFTNMINDIEEFDYKMNNNLVSISFGTCENIESKLVEDTIINTLVNTTIKNNLHIIYKINQINKINPNIIKLINDNKKISFSFNNHMEFFSTGEKIYTNINDDELSSKGRCIISKTSINLARLGINNQRKTLDEFYNDLQELLDFTKNQLVQRFDYQSNNYKKSFPNLFKYNLLLDSEKLEDNQKIRKVLKNGVLNIGLVGIKECVDFLPEKNKEKLLINILKFINEKIIQYTNDTKLNFIVSQTTENEVLTELIKIDKTIYGQNIYENSKNKYSILGKYDNETLNTYNNIQDNINIKVNINIRKNTSEQKIIEIMNNVKKVGIEYFEISCGKNED